MGVLLTHIQMKELNVLSCQVTANIPKLINMVNSTKQTLMLSWIDIDMHYYYS